MYYDVLWTPSRVLRRMVSFLSFIFPRSTFESSPKSKRVHSTDSSKRVTGSYWVGSHWNCLLLELLDHLFNWSRYLQLVEEKVQNWARHQINRFASTVIPTSNLSPIYYTWRCVVSTRWLSVTKHRLDG